MWHTSSYDDSLVLDTKYGRWRSGEVLKVLGYMTDYGVCNGAVVFRYNFMPVRVGGTLVCSGLVRFDFPGTRRNRLWALSLG